MLVLCLPAGLAQNTRGSGSSKGDGRGCLKSGESGPAHAEFKQRCTLLGTMVGPRMCEEVHSVLQCAGRRGGGGGCFVAVQLRVWFTRAGSQRSSRAGSGRRGYVCKEACWEQWWRQVGY